MGVSSATGGFVRRSLQGRPAAPLQFSTAQLSLLEQDFEQPNQGTCHSTSTPRQGLVARWEPCSGLGPSLFPPQECSTDPPTASGWLHLPSPPSPLLGQPAKDSPGSRGDSALVRWGFLPNRVLLMSAKLCPEEGAQPALPPNVCILTLAMMIAGIPTIPVPGVCEEEMIQAAQFFMAENLADPGGVGEADRRRTWAAAPRLGASCKRDRLRKRATHRRLLPLFLAQLEK